MSTKDNRYKHSDDLGSYSVCFGDRTIEVKFVGFLSDSLIEKFCHDLGLMLGVIEWKFWGYYGDLTECDDESVASRDILVDLQKRFLKQGCIVDAYSIINPVAIKHVTKLRKNVGLEHYLLKENLFSDHQKAIDFIHSVLLKIEQKQSSQTE